MTAVSFDDVLIAPQFSELKSRSEVDLSTDKFVIPMKLPIFSSNMATITETSMCEAMYKSGGLGVLHRFMNVSQNVQQLPHGGIPFAVSVGLGKDELYRAENLILMGCEVFFLDVAHGAQRQVAEQYKQLKKMGCEFVVVGNFGHSTSFEDWNSYCDMEWNIDAIKIGIGPGSVCTTRVKTGVGYPQIDAIESFKELLNWEDSPAIIADGGMKIPGDIAKALAAGADAVMIGGMLAGTSACPEQFDHDREGKFKVYKYSGSAHKTNEEGYCTSEGESKRINYKGETSKILKDIEGGLRSAFTYVGAKNIEEFHKRAELVEISSGTRSRNGAHY